MFKLNNQDEIKKLEQLRKQEVAEFLKELLKRELAMQHRNLENAVELNETFVIKGRCEFTRQMLRLLSEDNKIDDSEIVDLYFNLPEEKPKAHPPEAPGKWKRILKAIGLLLKTGTR